MKNKVQIAVLGLAVFLIWSLVVYRFFDLKNPDTPQVSTRALKRIEAVDHSIEQPFEYHLNYSEPFAVNQQRDLLDKQQQEAKQKKVVKKKNPPKKVIWPKITYIGRMSSSVKGEKDSYFIELDDKTLTLTHQDSINDLKILQLTPDSVWFEKEKEKKAFYIE